MEKCISIMYLCNPIKIAIRFGFVSSFSCKQGINVTFRAS